MVGIGETVVWTSFAIALLVAIVILYVPGWLFCKGIRFNGVMAVACAPVPSIAAYSVLSVLYEKTGISCNALTMFAPVILVSLALFVVSRITRKDDSAILSLPGETSFEIGNKKLPFDACAAVAYMLMAIIVCSVLFIANLDSASGFFCRWDNQVHMNLIRSFVESGVWSSLTTNVYADAPANANPFLAQPSFYPAAWHDLVALDVCISGATYTVAINAVNVALVVTVLPLSMFAFMKALFPEDGLTVAVGAVLTMSFAAFPWDFFIKGPLYPNLLGLIMIPVVAAAFIVFVDGRLLHRKPIALILFGLASFVALALSHPNCVFGLFLVLAPYVGHCIGSSFDGKEKLSPGTRTGLKVLSVGVFAALCVAFWLFCYKLPFLQDTVQYTAGGHKSLLVAIAVFGSISFPKMRPEPLVMIVCIVGLIHCLRSKRFWILFPPVYMAITFIVTIVTTDTIQHILAGFWYCDYHRIGTFLALFLIPVASVGLATVIRHFALQYDSLSKGKHSTAVETVESLNTKKMALIVAVFLAITFLPFVPIPGTDVQARLAFGYLNDKLEGIYSPESSLVYDFEEREFVDEVVDLVGEEELVINMPQDGSVFAYSVNDLNAYYRNCRAGNQTDAGKTIRNGLCNYAEDESVQQAVQDSGAQYLLLLDEGVSYEDGTWMEQYKKPEDWTGITSITDETPGFTVVLSEGDMRLYEIDSAA